MNQLPKQWELRPRKSLHQEQPPRKASQHISHIEQTCQQGTAVQDTSRLKPEDRPVTGEYAKSFNKF